jgi:uncharacterized membrane protein
MASRWNISDFHDPYNACLSITILPTMLARVTRISDPYLFKFVLQGLFALTPVCVFLIGRRMFRLGTGYLAALLCLGFPTFFTDMPFITRQEVGFTFLAVAVLMLSDLVLGLATRRFWFLVMAVAVVLSHYSTTYLLIITLCVGQIIWRTLDAWHWWRRRRSRNRISVVGPPRGRPVAGIVSTGVVALVAFVWTVPATHTSSQVRLTVVTTVDSLLGRQQASSSTDLSYSLFHGTVLTPQQELQAYERETLAPGYRYGGDFLSASAVARYQVRSLPSADLAPTTAGRALAKTGLSPETFNSIVRRALADFYQLAAVAGLALAALRLARGRLARGNREFVFLAAGSFVGLAGVLVLPDLSAEYGLLRAFQQALIFLAPLIAEATVSAVELVTRKRAEAVSVAFGVAACVSLTGVLPQVLGGYTSQLSLNNSGPYYQDYYLQPQEQTAIDWLDGNLVTGATVQAEVETDRYTYYLIGHQGVGTTDDIFPTLIRKNAYVFVGASTVTDGQASISYDGNTVSYKYPLGLLDSQKALVFSSPKARVYR